METGKLLRRDTSNMEREVDYYYCNFCDEDVLHEIIKNKHSVVIYIRCMFCGEETYF